MLPLPKHDDLRRLVPSFLICAAWVIVRSSRYRWPVVLRPSRDGRPATAYFLPLGVPFLLVRVDVPVDMVLKAAQKGRRLCIICQSRAELGAGGLLGCHDARGGRWRSVSSNWESLLPSRHPGPPTCPRRAPALDLFLTLYSSPPPTPSLPSLTLTCEIPETDLHDFTTDDSR